MISHIAAGELAQDHGVAGFGGLQHAFDNSGDFPPDRGVGRVGGGQLAFKARNVLTMRCLALLRYVAIAECRAAAAPSATSRSWMVA
jgi:hypothetical protein